MPSKGTTRITARQKAAVAAGRLAGKSIPQIAAEIGAAPNTVAHVAVGPEVKGIINRVMAVKEGRMFGVFDRLLTSLEADMDPASKLTFDQRERARDQVLAVFQLGQPKLPDTPAAGIAGTGGGVFLSDMLMQYRSIVAGTPPVPE